jgi:hypothetical protein
MHTPAVQQQTEEQRRAALWRDIEQLKSSYDPDEDGALRSAIISAGSERGFGHIDLVKFGLIEPADEEAPPAWARNGGRHQQ